MFLAGLTMDSVYVGLGGDRLEDEYIPLMPAIFSPVDTDFEDLDPMP